MKELEQKNILEQEVTVSSKSKDVFKMDFWRNNRFWMVRVIFWMFYSVWLVVMVVGGFIAWLISFLFI